MTTAIFQKELRGLSRDRRALGLAGLVGGLLLTAFVVSYSQWVVRERERASLQQTMYHKWTHQAAKNAHGAAHYGTFVFTPRPLLSFFDPGIVSYVGSIIRVTAHTQNEALYSEAGDSGPGARFGDFSAALVLQLLIPLLLIFLGFDAVTSEKAGGTFGLLLTQGVSIRTVLWQKAGAYSAVAGLILLSVLGTTGMIVVLSPDAGSDWPLRLLGLGVVYGAYYGVLAVVTVGVSALSRNAGTSLLTLLGLWLLASVGLPKLAANVGTVLYPLPAKQTFMAAIDHDFEQGINGHDPGSERNKRFVSQLLQQYKVDTVAKLPVNADGLLMQADEDYRAAVTRHHFGAVYDQIQRQNGVSQWLSWVDPFLSVRELSMRLSGTDYAHQVELEEQVQTYKMKLVRRLNTYMATHSRTGDWTTPAERALFTQTPDFRYRAPSVGWSLADGGLVVGSLLGWLGLSMAWLGWVAKRISPL